MPFREGAHAFVHLSGMLVPAFDLGRQLALLPLVLRGVVGLGLWLLNDGAGA